jgi:hypothetical protein
MIFSEIRKSWQNNPDDIMSLVGDPFVTNVIRAALVTQRSDSQNFEARLNGPARQ